MVKMVLQDFSIKKICDSGQCFRCSHLEHNTYSIIAFGKYLEIKQYGNEVLFDCSQKEFDEIWYDYFDLGTDYKAILNTVPAEDSYLTQAITYGKGIRILKQDLWEMIISFIISQQNNIKRIRKIIELLSDKYGEAIHTEKGIYHTFPNIEQLSNATEEELKSCNLGYRAKYIVKTTNAFLQNEINLEDLKNKNYEDAKRELMKLYGVGEKVADCICLFGLHHLEAFPIDTHIKSVLNTHYKDGFHFDLYAGYQGVIQQYLFYYDLFKGEEYV